MQLRLEMCRHLVAAHCVWARLTRIIGTVPQIGGVRYVRHADIKNNPMHSRCAARDVFIARHLSPALGLLWCSWRPPDKCGGSQDA
jgi:hypothetical protein